MLFDRNATICDLIKSKSIKFIEVQSKTVRIVGKIWIFACFLEKNTFFSSEHLLASH